MTWEEHVKTSLSRYQKGFEAGHPEALQDAVIFCVQSKVTMNQLEFPGLQLAEFCMREFERRRSPNGHPIEWADDWKFMNDMDGWRGQLKPGTNRHYSIREAAKKIHEQDHPGWSVETRRDGVDPLRAYVERYDRAVKRFASEKYEHSDWAF